MHRAGWWSTVIGGSVPPAAGRPPWSRARRLSPAGHAGRTHRPRARRLSPSVPPGRPPWTPCSEAQPRSAGWWSPAPGACVPLWRLVEPRGPRQEAQTSRAGCWSPRPGGESRPASWSTPGGRPPPRAQRPWPERTAGRPPRPAPGGSVRPRSLVEQRARWLTPAVLAGGAPRPEAESRRDGWSTAVAHARGA